MRKLIFFVGVLIIPFTASSQWLTGYSFKSKITVDGSQVCGASSLVNFPLLVQLTGNFLKPSPTGLITSANGYDIVFTASDGTTLLNHQIDHYISATGEFAAWVRIPSLPPGSNTDIYMYYGNSSVTTDQSSPGTWNANIKTVYHFQNNNFNDGTANAINSTNNGTTNVTAKIGDGRDLDGTAGYIQTNSSELKTDNNFSISAWFKSDATTPGHIIWQGGSGSTLNGWGTNNAAGEPEMNLSMGLCCPGTVTVNNQLSFFLGDREEEVNTDGLTAVTPFTNTTSWQHVVATVSNMSTSPVANVYLNGTLVSTNTGAVSSVTDRSTWGTNLRIGRPSANTRFFNGQVDEVRIYNTALTPDWICTEYTNQSSTTFTTLTNHPAVLATIEGAALAYTEDDAATAITSTLTATDWDNNTFQSATVSITSGYQSSEDVLAFTNAFGITGSWSAGVLTLTGPASIANFVSAMRAVTYVNTNTGNPSATTRTVSFQVNDGAVLSNIVTRNITVTPVNDAPTNISISASSLNENLASGTSVGSFSSTDPDVTDTFTYTLVAGAGSTDNASFTIAAGVLKTSAVFDFETKSSYSIRVRSTDAGSLFFEKVFTVTVNNVNEAPSNIALSATTVNENLASGTSVGSFSSTDADAGDTFTYTLVAGVGSTDNATFTITAGVLKTNAIFDFETKSSYSIRVRSTDAGSLFVEKVFTITVNNVNEAPTDIALSATTVNENLASGTSVGNFSSTDVDAGDTFTYTLVAGAGSTDNASFTIAAGVLKTGAIFDFENKNSYSIRVRSTDAGSLFFEKIFTITVNNVNEAPTDIALSATTVNENLASGTSVGNFSSTDVDAGDTFTYTLVAGAGSTDNASFTIAAGVLKTSAIFDFETKNSYSIRVRSTDAGSLFFEKIFTITVNNVNEAPTDIALSTTTVNENLASGTSVGNFSSTDVDAGDTFTYTLVAGAGSTDNTSFTIVAGVLKTNAVFDFETKNSYSIRVRSTDAGSLFFEKIFTITVNNVNEAPTDIALSATTVNENLASGTSVGNFSSTDVDASDTFTYTLVAGVGSTDNASFTIAAGVLKTSAVFDFETKSSYSIRVRSTDAGSLFFEKVFTITVNNVNEAPTDIALSATTINENLASGTSAGNFSSTDVDAGDTFTYTLVAGVGSTDNASFTIAAGVLKTNAIFDFETKSSYSIRVRSTDAGSLFFEKVFTITVNNVNEAPTDIALSASTVNENLASGTSVGNFSSTDVDASDTFTYTLVAGAGSTDNASFTIAAGVLKTSAIFDFETKSSYSIRVRSTDAGSLFFEKIFTIIVNNVNEAPTDIALSATTVNENLASGTSVGNFSSTDIDAGDTFTYTLVAGAGSTDNASFTIAAGVLKTSAIFDFETKGSYSIRVRSTDAGSLFFEKIFTITVNNVNEAPTDIALSATTVNENLASGTSVGSFSSTDADAGDTFTYTLVAGVGSTDNTSFTIAAGVLKTSAVFDFETKSSYSVRVRSTDAGSLFFEKVFTITVNNVNEAPTDIALSATTVNENLASGTSVGNFSSTDVDAGDTFTYTLVAGVGSTDNASFTIAAGVLKTSAIFDFETKNSYSIRVRSTDAGSLFFEKIFTITVNNVNEAPTDIALSATTVNENLASGTSVGNFSSTDVDAGDTFTYTLVAGAGSTDNASFTIAAGVLKTGAIFDFETKNSYSIRVRSTDAGSLFVEKIFTITVNNVNEAPTDIALSATTVNENLASGTSVGNFSSTDVDAGDTFTYTLVAGAGSTDNASFTIAAGVLKTSAIFDFETKNSYSIRVRSTDAGSLFFEKIFTITVNNVNEAPTDIALSANTVNENLASGTSVGNFSSTDVDAGDTFTYTLVAGVGSTDNASFTLAAGVLKTNAIFDFETKNSYSIRVRSTDAGSLFFEKIFTITVNNVNEVPTNIALSAATVNENLVSGTTVGNFSSTDVDASDTFTYTLVAGAGSTDNASFTIAAGVLKTNAVFDFETKNSYSIRVRSTDAGSLFFEKIFTITVNNVNEAPTDIALSANTVNENLASGTSIGGFSSTDVDAGDTFTYTLVVGAGSTDNASFTIVAGVLKTNAVFDFETKSSYSIRVRSTDAGSLFFEKIFTITVNNVNEAPTDIALSATAVNENLASGTSVGNFSSTDVDAGDTFTYTLVAGAGSTDNASFTLAAGVLKTNASFDFETKNSYSIRIRSTDAGSLFFEKIFTITVTNVNEAPVAANDNVTTSEDNAIPISVLANDTDVDNAIDPATIILGTAPSNGLTSINTTTGVITYTPNPNYNGSDSFTYTVKDVSGAISNLATVSITITPVNDAPTDIALSPSSVAESLPSGTSVGNFSSTDVDAGDTFTYTLVAGADSTDNTSFTIAAGVLKTNAIFDFETKNSYSIRVRSTDAGGLLTEKVFTIAITLVNEAPTDIALSPSTVNENLPSGSSVGNFSTTDANSGDTFTYTLVAGAGSTDNASFTIAAGVLKTSAIFDFETKTSYSIRVRSTDAGSLFIEKTFTISVNNVNEAPTDIALSTSTINENLASGTSVGSFSSTDVDAGDTFTYTLVAGVGSTDNASFTIAAGVLKTNAVFDFETKNSYSIRVRSTDAGSLFFEKVFTITVNNVNEAPTDIALSAATVNENLASGTSVGNFSSTDADAGDTFTYTLVAGAGSTDNTSFTIAAGVLKTNAVFDFETKSSYSIRVRSTDAGSLFFEKIFTITVNNVNEAPSDIALSATAIDENLASGTSIGSFSSTDVDAGDTFTYTLVAGAGSTDNVSFTIAAGVLKTNAIFDFETKSSYSIRVRSTDAGSLFVEKTFTITVNNVNEAPSDIVLSATTVDENLASGTSVGSFSSTDADAGDTFTYTLVAGAGSTDNANFTIAAGVLKTNAVFDFETKSSYSIRVRSTDAGSLFFEKIFTITVNNVNEAPTDIALSATTINENLASGTSVGNFSSTDADASDTFTYTLVAGAGSTDNASFSIAAGVLKTNAVFDFETKNSYSIRVRSTDTGSLFFEKVFTITVNNVNEAPTDIALSATTVNENLASGTSVGNFSSTDVDAGDTFTYTLVAGAGSTDNASFTIAAGVLKTSAIFDFETKSSYSIRVRSTDAGSLFFEKVFTITVNNVNEAPVAANDNGITTPEDISIAIDVLANDSDVDNALDLSSVTILSSPTNGNVSVNTSTGIVTYTPGPDYNGNDSFTYTVKDVGLAVSGIATVSIVITPVNDTPVAKDDISTTSKETSIAIAILQNDSDVDDSLVPSGITIESLPANGTVSVNSSGVTYTPGAGFVGSDSFTYTISDASGAKSNVAVVSITVTPTDNAPLAVDDNPVLIESTQPFAIDVLANDSDPDNTLAELTVVSVSTATFGTVTIENNQVVYQTSSEVSGNDSFTYVIRDPAGLTDTATVTIQYSYFALTVSEGFSPNNDESNNTWYIKSIENFPNNSVKVFDRWGILVYQCNHYENAQGWNGRANTGQESGKLLDEGTYYYLLDPGNKKVISGFVTIVR